MHIDILRCPISGQRLTQADDSVLEEIESKRLSGKLFRKSGQRVEKAIQQALVTEDQNTIYPVLEGIPQLLAPEGVFLGDSSDILIDIHEKQYWEPYAEMKTYDEISDRHIGAETLHGELGEKIKPYSRITKTEQESFPQPIDLWLDAKGCLMAQEAAYNYLNPLSDNVVLQIGGHGSHLVKFLLAGAREACLVSPIMGELRRARFLSQMFEVEDRFFPVQGIAEELPFRTRLFDRVYSGGCLHHTRLEMSGPEIFRVLKDGGKGSFVDPVLTVPYRMFVRPFYSRGLGRMDHAECTPIPKEQIDRFMALFGDGSVLRSRTFCHFPLIMAIRYLKLGINLKTIRRIEELDSIAGNYLPTMRQHFSPIICLCVEKQGTGEPFKKKSQ